MEIKALSATFGRLENETLSLSPGLNVIEAGNESGKTTWMAFLRVMLYGLNTRDRSPLADKHRYMPWTGSAMQGRMDLNAEGSVVTITRTTSRANSPMGSFSAHFTDTTTPVPGITSATLGEALLGVPQDVFERSAFIRQSGIPIDQSSALERRIAALITTGEEDSSYTDASDRLRKQLTRRRYNKTGLLPQLEAEIATLEGTLSEISTLETTLRANVTERDALLEREAYLRHQLELHTAAEDVRRIQQLSDAREALTRADAAKAAAARRIAVLPTRDELTAIRAELDALDAMSETVQSTLLRTQECASSLEQAEQQLSSHPFAPQTPEEASNAPVTNIPRPHLPGWTGLVSAFVCTVLIPILHFGAHLSIPLSVGITMLIAALYLLVIGLISARRQKLWEADVAAKRRIRQEEVAVYTLLYNTAEQERTAYRSAAETHHTLASDLQLRLDRTLSRVRRFCPVDTIAAARSAIEDAFARHAAFTSAAQAHREAQLSFELLSEHTPQVTDLPTEAPSLSRDEAEKRLQAVTARLSELHRLIHTAQGRCQALGDPLLLQADLEQRRSRHNTLQKEYDAISLASDVLTNANTTLQSRFSPALGEKAANIFTKLTRGKYNKVLLDRKMTPSAQEDGGFLAHAVPTLSQGAADQLYLAVRLAICDMVLPADKRVPIFLDDALVTFDDARMAAALDYLVELSEQRQILLFTCQKRELNYLRAAHSDRYHVVTVTPAAQ